MQKMITACVAIALLAALLASCSGNGTRSSVRFSYGVGVGHFRYGYRPWYPCGIGCRPPIIDRPRPELPIEPPIFEATPLPSMDFDMDYGVW